MPLATASLLLVSTLVVFGCHGASVKAVPGYNAYFNAANNALKGPEGKGESTPFLDMDLLNANIREIKTFVPPSAIRLVTKSLPSLDLLSYLMKEVGTKRLMVFSTSMLRALLETFGNGIDILWGQPLTVQGFERFLRRFKLDPSLLSNVQWLVDTTERLESFANLAGQYGLNLQISVEIDVGLHRGGAQNTTYMASMLRIIEDRPLQLTFRGFMGYDGHVANSPWIEVYGPKAYWSALNESASQYIDFIEAGQSNFPKLFERSDLTFNGAGSNTIGAYRNLTTHPLNDYAAGSAFTKPADFSIFTLDTLQHALWAGFPVLKDLGARVPIPFAEQIWPYARELDKGLCQSFFLDGVTVGAEYVSPTPVMTGNPIEDTFSDETKINNLYPTQSLAQATCDVGSRVGDYVFAVPREADFMLQFEELFLYFSSNGSLSEQTFSIFRGGI